MIDALHITANRFSVREDLEKVWDKLCAEYLPIVNDDSIWRYSPASGQGGADQGWKLHVSATILNAPRILKRTAPFLVQNSVEFKAPRSLADVANLNCGFNYAYCQVGKVITVYPRTDEEAVYLAGRLHQLTYRFKAPAVPFDLRLREKSNVYYRYGAFKHVELERNGQRVPAIVARSGELMADLRENPKPDWVADPFQANRRDGKLRKRQAGSSGAFRVVRALVQRGKGGVYQAVDVQSNPPRMCLLKEGRRHGEIDWDGRDGAWRVRHEDRVLSCLLRAGISVPRVYSRFEVEGNFYLIMEFVDGQSLQGLLLKRQRRLPIRSAVSFGIEIASFLAQMHHAGWAWRDCKPYNLIVRKDGTLVPIDFEGAEHIRRPDSVLWGTAGFMPRLSRRQTAHSGLTDDLYALGAILFLLITGRVFDEARPTSIAECRRNVSSDLSSLVESLLVTEPQTRPSADQIRDQLMTILLCSKPQPAGLADSKAA